MGGFHPLDLIVIIGVALLIFGPKTLQSIAHSTGRGLGKANQAKEKIQAELPMEELAKVSETIAQIPLTPQQAAQKVVKSALLPDEKKKPDVEEMAEKRAQE